MALKVINKNACISIARDARALQINQSGVIALSDKAKKELGIKEGDHVVFARDDETGKWYVSFGRLSDGFDISPKDARLSNSRQEVAKFHCRILARTILSSIGNNVQSATVSISRQPREQDENGRSYFLIDTAHPLRVETKSHKF